MIVLDTHVIVWDALQPERISNRAKDKIRRANDSDGIVFCEISLWEIAMLLQKGRLSVDVEYEEFIGLILKSKNYVLKGITPSIAKQSVQLPEEIGRDPADRIIAATAIVTNSQLITADHRLQQSDSVQTLW